MPYKAQEAHCQKFHKATLPREQLARVRRSFASSWQSDGVGYPGGDRGLAGAAHRPARPVPFYSNLAIETGPLLRWALGRPWRQTEGLLRSIMPLLGVNLAVPDHTTFSRRSTGLSLPTSLTPSREPVQVVIDSTGLKVYGAGEWQREKHGERGRRTWRKLPLAMNPDTNKILAAE
jgi:hypothetical protein